MPVVYTWTRTRQRTLNIMSLFTLSSAQRKCPSLCAWWPALSQREVWGVGSASQSQSQNFQAGKYWKQPGSANPHIYSGPEGGYVLVMIIHVHINTCVSTVTSCTSLDCGRRLDTERPTVDLLAVLWLQLWNHSLTFRGETNRFSC